MSLLRRGSKMAGAVAPPFFYNGRASMFKPPCNAKPLIINVRFGSCVTSVAGPNGGAQLYER